MPAYNLCYVFIKRTSPPKIKFNLIKFFMHPWSKQIMKSKEYCLNKEH